jgi:acyl CoA:acetate/3-ketoacid CoA transferase beta subunit
MDFTPDEMMVVCMARQIKDGEVVVQGLATPLVAAAYLLARHTHAPNLYFLSAIGQGICRKPAPLGLTRVESLWLDQAITNVGFVRGVADVMPSLLPKEYFRPAQVDAHGNFNNIAFGNDYHNPRLRLPGTGGIPDVTTYLNDICLYVPRHSRVTFVPKLDFQSGLGHNPARTRGEGPSFLVTDLGVFDFAPENSLTESIKPPRKCTNPGTQRKRMRLLSYHPGVEITRIQAKTGFDILIPPDVHQTIPPTQDELRLLREDIDPLGIRRLESLSGTKRRELLHQIIALEAESNHS